MDHDQIEMELQRLHPDTFGWALACCGRSRSEAEDVMQLAYVKVLEGSAKFDGRSSFRTWLFGVVRLTAMERRRRLALRNRLLKLWGTRDAQSQESGPDLAIEYSARSKQLLDGLNSLSKRQSQVLHLAFYHDMTLDEVAAVLGLSIGSTRTHYARGKKNLARALQASPENESADE